MSVERPVFMYLGSKWRIAPWIISHFPAHDFYIEPFGGSAAVLLRKPPAPMGEVYNDKYGRVLNVFRVLRDPQLARRLMRMLRFTPYSHEEFLAAKVHADGIVEDARRMLVMGLRGFGGTMPAGGQKTAGWRRNTRIDDFRAKRNTPKIWLNTWRHVNQWAERMRGVYLENEEAVDVIRRWDSERALIYCDPPYVHATRPNTRVRGYCYEMTDDQHRELAGVLRACKGMVILSGYDCPLYQELYPLDAGEKSGSRKQQPEAEDGNTLAECGRLRTHQTRKKATQLFILWLNFPTCNSSPQTGSATPARSVLRRKARGSTSCASCTLP